jgi:TonB-dependent starch-binding outer membrane protein SusC
MNLGMAGEINSQNLSKVKVSISLTDAKLTAVFREIEARTQFVFAYSEPVTSMDKSFNLKYDKVSLRTILTDLAAEANVEFKRINNTISVSTFAKPDLVALASVPAITVTGAVVDETNNPLPGVNVLERGTTNGTTTDVNGQFTLSVADANSVLVISFIGYASQEPLELKQTLMFSLRQMLLRCRKL